MALFPSPRESAQPAMPGDAPPEVVIAAKRALLRRVSMLHEIPEYRACARTVAFLQMAQREAVLALRMLEDGRR